MKRKNHQKHVQGLVKRLFDIVFSLLLLIILLPVFAILSVWIVINDGFPIIYKQKRSGLNNSAFFIYKFRSMKNKQVSVASNSHSEYDWPDGVPDDFVFKMASEDNPNITRVGRFIRKYSLDELPQLLNVLKGDMSLIGPRPEIIAISKHYNAEQARRLEVLPGITGWAQVKGRSDMDHGEKIRHDLYYVDHFSLLLDCKIMWHTLVQVARGKGSV